MTMGPQIRAALFDFDYTLADSSDAIVECFNAGLAGLGLPAADPHAIRRTIGWPIPDSLARVVGEEHRRRADEFRDHWRKRSDEIMVDRTRLFDVTRGAVRRTRRDGLRLGIVSTKWRQRILDVLARDGLSECFDVVVGGDDVTRLKPDPEGLRLALERLALRPDQAFYVGDSVADARAAHQAGVAFVAVLSGVTVSHEFALWQPLAIVEHVGELPTWIAEAAVTIPD